MATPARTAVEKAEAVYIAGEPSVRRRGPETMGSGRAPRRS
jgi:hypothetical protein